MTVLPTLDPTDSPGASSDALEVPKRAARGTRERVAAHALVADIARRDGDALLRTARRFSACADDAHDAYQRAMELLLAHAGKIDRAKAVPWLHVVVRREAGAIRRAHDRNVSLDDEDVEEATARLAIQADDQLDTIDLARRAGEALATLKDSEAQALCLRAQGLSYDEIADAYGWSYTKVNRVVTEGRRAFVAHYRAVENGLVCADTTDLVGRFAAGELKPRVALKVRAHLVRCSACRALLHAERQADASLRALLPMGTVATAGSGGWLHDHLLAPLGHLAGRLQPAADHLVASKLGLAAASTVALASSGIAVEHRLRADPAPAIRTALTADQAQPAANQAQPNTPQARITLPAALSTASKRGNAIAKTERRRVAAAKRRKAAAAAKRAKATRAAANRSEFGPGAGEFSGTSRSTAATAARSSGTGSGTSAAAPSAPAAEVPVTDPTTDSSVGVAPESPSSSAPTSSSVSDEFGP